MKRSRVFRLLAYFTIMLILLSIFPKVSFAAKNSSEHGKGNQDKYMREDASNSFNNENDDADDTGYPVADKEKLQNNHSVKDQNKISYDKQEKNQLKEDLQAHEQEYKDAKGDFLRSETLLGPESLTLTLKRL